MSKGEGGEAPTLDDVVHAAGGVLWRPSGKSRSKRRDAASIEVAVVHRPRYDDWSLPKGKCHRGETHLECARREVLEETGYEVEVGDEVAIASYVDGKGRPKIVRYWAMRPAGGSFTPGDEVDELRWLPIDEAVEILTYRYDAKLLRRFVPPRG